ncbi:MAG: SctF chaperone SctG [Simkania negevensis]|nr:SctF chaperone SctG [Simkania negevensis]
MENLTKFKEDLLLFLEAGFIATNQADEDSAQKLYKACQLLSPENSLIKVGIGYLHLHKLELKQACELFEQVIAKEPDNELAKTMLGIALSLTPDKVTKGEKLLESTMKSSSDPHIKKVASTTLDFVEQFVKKAPGPADVKRK